MGNARRRVRRSKDTQGLGAVPIVSRKYRVRRDPGGVGALVCDLKVAVPPDQLSALPVAPSAMMPGAPAVKLGSVAVISGVPFTEKARVLPRATRVKVVPAGSAGVEYDNPSWVQAPLMRSNSMSSGLS